MTRSRISRRRRRVLSPRTPSGVRRGLGAVHRLVRRHRAPGAARRPGHRHRVPDRLPGRAGDPAPPGRGHRPPPHRDRTATDRGSRSRCGPRWAGPPANPPSPPTETGPRSTRRSAALPSHGWTHGMFGRRDRCLLVLSQLAGVPYQAPGHADRRRRHPRRRRRDDPLAGRGVDASSGRRRPAVRGVRGRPVAGGPGPGGHQGRHRRGRPGC